MIEKIYRHFYDNSKDSNGNEKPNEYLGEFEVVEGRGITGYSFDFIGIKKEDGKRYKVFGMEISALVDRYNAGTQCCIEEINKE